MNSGSSQFCRRNRLCYWKGMIDNLMGMPGRIENLMSDSTLIGIAI